MLDLRFVPKLLLQHDSSPETILEDVHAAFLQAVKQRSVQSSVSPSGDGLAVSLGQRLVVLNGLTTAAAAGGRPAVDFVSAVDAPETVTALCWLAAGAQSTDECILLGTSSGHLQLHAAATGARLLRQPLHHSAAVGAAVRWSGSGSDPEDRSEDVTLAFSDAVVRLPAWEVWAAVRWHAGQAGRGGSWWGGGGENTATAAAGQHQLSFSKFTLPKGTGPRSHAVCLGPPPPSLYAALAGRREPPTHRLHILTAGAAPPLAAYEGEESAAPGLLSLVSDLASSTAQSLLGRARAYVPAPAAAAGRTLLGGLRRGGGGSGGGSGAASSSGGSSGGGSEAQQQQQAQARKDKIPGEPASLAAAVWDEKRSVTQMALSPCGRLAACCDSLGRVLLVDTAGTLVVGMLKGYRDAQVAWLVCHGGSGGGGGSPGKLGGSSGQGLAPLGGSDSSLASLADGGGSSAAGSLRGSAADVAALAQEQLPAGGQQPAAAAPPQQAQQPQQQRRQGWQQVVVTYAPRRLVVELWEPHSLTRVGSLPCATQLGLLLHQPARRESAGGGGGGGPPAANKCLLLDAAALTLLDLTAQLSALL